MANKTMMPAPQASALLGGARTRRLTTKLGRPLAATTTVQLALGLIAAAILGDLASPRSPANGRPTQLPPADAPALSAFAPPPLAGTSLGDFGLAAPALGPVLTAGATQPSSAPDSVPVAAGSSPSSAPPSSGGSTTPPPAQSAAPRPLLQLAVGVAAGTNVSVALGVGAGSCTGVSLAGTSSCAPAPPSAPGVSLTLSSPLGTVSTPAVAPGAVTTTLPPVAAVPVVGNTLNLLSGGG